MEEKRGKRREKARIKPDTCRFSGAASGVGG
jgi:hypothetical protein